MSSDEDSNGINGDDFRVLTGLPNSETSKRKRVARACDVCRKKKIRCNAQSEPNMEKCNHCLAFKLGEYRFIQIRRCKYSHMSRSGAECTFVEGPKKRSPPKSNLSAPTPTSTLGSSTAPRDMLYRYIKDLEERIALLEKLLRRVAPNVNIDAEVGLSFDKRTWEIVKEESLASRTSCAPATQVATASSTLHVLSHATMFTMASKDPQSRFSSPGRLSMRSGSLPALGDLESSDGEANLTRNDGTGGDDLEKEMEKLSLGDPAEKKFLGKSSGVSLVRAALALKGTMAGSPKIHDAHKHKEGGSRSKFWKASPWEWMASALPPIESLRFPPPDLIRTLVDHCFNDTMPLMPILHRPSFERQYAEEKHRTDFDFARLLLVVCSIGAQTTNDARVCLTSPEGETEWNSAGWIYFAQMHQIIKPIPASAKLVDLQIMALSAIYLEKSEACSSAWLISGIGVKYAQDAGAHRETVYSDTHAFENQMWKRTFWCLVQKDREYCSGLGRPMCMHDEDMDVQLPLEVDDDGWDEAKQIWVQPVDKPSQLTFLIQLSKLGGILANCMRTLYCINKSKVRLGFVGVEWEQDKVSELDSALNEWQEALPDHLMWDPHMSPTFYQQAATLRITFDYIQINIHRPFIELSSSSRRALSLPSLTVCTNAARSAARILETTMEMPSSPVFVMASLLSGVMLMISILEARRSGLNIDTTRQISGIQTCLNYLKRWENRHHLAGRLYDILRQTVSAGDVLLPLSHATPSGATNHSGGNSTKRSREDDSPGHDSQSGSNFSFSNTGGARSTTGHVAPSPDPLQYTRAASMADLNKGVYPTHDLDGCAPQLLPVTQWPSQSGGDPLSALESTWHSLPISGSGFPELSMRFHGLPGYGMQELDWQELLGPLVPDKEHNIPSLQPEHRNNDPINQWDWLNGVPDVSAYPSTILHPPR
ncbi:hypothetical protein FRB93_009217 [Tulasnella sp. JGI-2019a]|nr:hypothetical protein FRB93_009217 [Tulasnella sp. JGI-2019a]